MSRIEMLKVEKMRNNEHWFYTLMQYEIQNSTIKNSHH